MHTNKLSADCKTTHNSNNKNLNSVRSDGLQLPVDGSPSKGSMKRLAFIGEVVKGQYKANNGCHDACIIRLLRSKAVVSFYAHCA